MKAGECVPARSSAGGGAAQSSFLRSKAERGGAPTSTQMVDTTVDVRKELADKCVPPADITNTHRRRPYQ
jgi:hypothetical protein